MAGRLDNKVCIVTGASSGQGRAGAEAFAREGALLVLSDVDAEGLEETAARCRKLGSEPILHVGDLTKEPPNQELMDLAAEQGVELSDERAARAAAAGQAERMRERLLSGATEGPISPDE